jgi:hypothetical protein
MLRWSSTETGEAVDLDAVATGRAGAGLDHGDQLLRFAGACAGHDDDALRLARRQLARVTDEAFMIDAAAVAANFEMMTRLADSTGAKMPPERLAATPEVIAVMNIAPPS